jgi:hypothetical protein
MDYAFYVLCFKSFRFHYAGSVYIPYWNLPFTKWLVPRQRKFHSDLKVINDCLDNLIKNAKETRQVCATAMQFSHGGILRSLL